jgi:hypothetical protein
LSANTRMACASATSAAARRTSRPIAGSSRRPRRHDGGLQVTGEGGWDQRKWRLMIGCQSASATLTWILSTFAAAIERQYLVRRRRSTRDYRRITAVKPTFRQRPKIFQTAACRNAAPFAHPDVWRMVGDGPAAMSGRLPVPLGSPPVGDVAGSQLERRRWRLAADQSASG